MVDFFTESFSSGGMAYLGIVVGLILTGAGLPVPEEFLILAAGAMSRSGTVQPTLAFIACLVGALLGDCVMYLIGRTFGRGYLQRRHWFAPFLTPEREVLIEENIRRHAFKVLFLARFLVGLRSPVFLAAGILRMRFRRFILIDLICATSVIALFFSLGYVFGEHLERLWRTIRRAEATMTGALLLACVAAGVYFYWKYRRAQSGIVEADKCQEPPLSPPTAGDQSKFVA